jgi:hypothetical protein
MTSMKCFGKSAALVGALGAVGLGLAGCGTMMSSGMKAPDAPAAVTVPAGHKVAMVLVGEGMLTYECRAGAAGATVPFAWSPPSPDAVLKEKNGAIVGKYYPGPTWEHNDGSKLTGKQLAVSPASTGIPLQLVQANPATGNGTLTNVTYIQRLNTVGGTAAGPCDGGNVGAKQVVKYAADYWFYKPM